MTTPAARDPGLPDFRTDAARNRQRVVEVAREQIDSGDLNLALNAIAKRAGVGVGTVYRHFPTSETLMEAVATRSFASLATEARQAAQEPDPGAALQRLIRFTLDLLASDRAFAAVLARPNYQCPETIHFAAQLGEPIDTVLHRARDAGLIRDDITADDLRRLVCALDYASHAGADGDAKADLYLEVLWKGVRPVSAPRTGRRATASP